MLTRSRILIVAALLLAALFVALRLNMAEAPRPDGTQGATEVADAATVTDLLGRQVRVRVPAQRVLLGEGRQLYLLAALDTEDPLRRIVGWRKDLLQSDPATYEAYRRRFPAIADIPVIGGFEDGSFDVERAAALKPDVIFLNIEAERAAADAHYLERLELLGIPVVYVDFRHYPMENTEKTLRLFGAILGKEARAEEFIAFRAEQIRRVTDIIAAHQPERPKVFIERIGGYTDDCCLSFGNENFGKFVELAGASNMAKALIPGTFGQLNPEQVIAASPAHVVVTSANWEAFAPGGRWIGVGPGADLKEAARKLAAYPSRPAYQGTPAQIRGNFHAIWHQFYNSPYQFVAIQQLAKWFHPDLFRELDPDAAFGTLHERFLPIPYEPGYFVSLKKEQP